jgi:hypothetical protein
MRLARGVLFLAMVMAPALPAFAEHDAKAAVKIVNGPVIESVFDDHAVIAWSTNAQSSTTLKYGTDQNNLNQQVQAPWGGSPHRVSVMNLQPNTTYYFKVMDANAQHTGTSVESPVFSFTTVAKGAAPQRENKNVGVKGETSSDGSSNSTEAVKVTNGPVIESVFDDKAVIAWSTNAKSSSTLKYGTDQNNLNEQVQAAWGGDPHRVTISNLKPSTTYYFKVMSANAEHTGTNVETPVYSFTTVAKGAPPQRDNKNVGVSTTSKQ